MKLSVPIFIITLFSMSQAAWAGRPINQEMSCAIGGEKFKVTSTMSCSSFGRTMSMQPFTSCGFVTHLPQCPGNQLPMYKEFSPKELVEVEKFMQTKTYKDAALRSRFLLAATIEQTLPSPDANMTFFLLQQGLWYEPKQTYENKD